MLIHNKELPCFDNYNTKRILCILLSIVSSRSLISLSRTTTYFATTTIITTRVVLPEIAATMYFDIFIILYAFPKYTFFRMLNKFACQLQHIYHPKEINICANMRNNNKAIQVPTCPRATWPPNFEWRRVWYLLRVQGQRQVCLLYKYHTFFTIHAFASR